MWASELTGRPVGWQLKQRVVPGNRGQIREQCNIAKSELQCSKWIIKACSS